MSLRDKYTREEFEEKENQIKNKKKDSLDMCDLLKPIRKAEDKLKGNFPDENKILDDIKYKPK